jgi:Arc/MetJ family transcription regulator
MCAQLCGRMATNLQIDDRLLTKALKIGGFKSKKDTVNRALTEFVNRREQRAISELFGTLEFTPDFDHKKLRANR